MRPNSRAAWQRRTAHALTRAAARLHRHPWRAALVLLLVFLLALDLMFPPPIPVDAPGTVVTARDGAPLRAWPDRDGVWRIPTTPEAVSPRYLAALLAYEDRWFDWHPGVNPASLVRALWQWLREGRIVSGGSTLTMQVARGLEPRVNWRSVPGKLRQIGRAVQLELRLSKREILTLYLNHAPMGGVVEGVEMASRSYLGKSAAQLSEAEAALLVVLPQAPSRLRPDRHPARAQLWRDKVLRRMAASGKWPDALVRDAMLEKVGANPPRPSFIAPLAAERLRGQAGRARGAGAQAIVRSTIDREMQITIERMLSDRVGQLPPFVSMAALVMDSRSLEVLAYAGSADFLDARRFGHVDMVKGIRSPGSTLKPFLYAMALDEGMIHSESLLADTPQSFGGYDPGNFQASFSGAVSAADALHRSLNVPAVDLLERVGPVRFAARLSGAGLRLRMASGAAPNLSIILGGAGTSLEELVGAYRALAADGIAGRPRLTADAPRREAPIMSAGAAFIVRSILEGASHPDQPFADHGKGPRMAWKTGTSYGFRDAWAVGVSERYTLGVWIGRPDGTPNPGFFGANVAAPLLQQIALALPRSGHRMPARPADVGSALICWPLGRALELTPPEHCHVKRSAWILNDTIPPTLPDRLRPRGQIDTVWIEGATGLRTTPACSPQAKARELARWPALLEAWMGGELRERHGAPPWSPQCAQSEPGAARLKLMGLRHGSRLRPPPGQQTLLVPVDAVGGSGMIYWLLDGRQVAAGRARTRAQIALSTPGPHSLAVVDSAGHVDSVQFSVDALPAPQSAIGR